jgi:hypothetical protein
VFLVVFYAFGDFIFAPPLFFLPFHGRSRELFCFLRPFLFFVLAQQAFLSVWLPPLLFFAPLFIFSRLLGKRVLFGVVFGVIFCFFLRPFIFCPFHGSAVNGFVFTSLFFAASAKRRRFCTNFLF